MTSASHATLAVRVADPTQNLCDQLVEAQLRRRLSLAQQSRLAHHAVVGLGQLLGELGDRGRVALPTLLVGAELRQSARQPAQPGDVLARVVGQRDDDPPGSGRPLVGQALELDA
jgi:hypothetical protein